MTFVLRVRATASTPALLLRPWIEADAEGLVEAYRDPVLRRWTRMPVAHAGDAARWLALQSEGWRSGKRHSFAVLADGPVQDGPVQDGPVQDGPVQDGPVQDGPVQDGPGREERPGRLLGNVALKTVEPGSGSAEVGYWTAVYARGRGIAPLALTALTGWAFETFAPAGLTRLDLLHQVDNAASCRVAEKAGYRFEQVLPARPPFPNDGHVHVRHHAPADAGPVAPVTSTAR
ncbi:GNAT family N-acetyltransferase [Micromonospora sp. NBC_01699]|uniref:GNAT family N-acetyltransferase n=1 Tax=Micromonospora sp. NBC_01699 TaxID=2975984 RepID=UPI002E28014D|nr:GNAT family N-acetyltransferase [Micromonospora sp. NBC_01699]